MIVQKLRPTDHRQRLQFSKCVLDILEAIAVNFQRYITMIEKFIILQLEENEYDTMCVKQDGVTAHTAAVSMQAVSAEMSLGPSLA